jgi:putative serine protease PepD
MNRKKLAVIPALAALGGAAAGVGGYAAFGTAGPTTTVVRSAPVAAAVPAATSSNLTVNEVYRRASAGVVEITVTTSGSNAPFPYGGGGGGQAQGSGFVYDKQGHIITNQHVVDSAGSIKVTLKNGATYSATVVGSDASTDLAVLKVDAPESALTPLSLGNSSQLEVGDGVVAIGSPFGLEETVTSGIVSALHRQITSPNNFTIDDSIQTDAAINHGNSGGPLLDLHGDVIGVNAQIESDSGGNDGVGFAIPSNTVRSVAQQLIASGKAEHAFLGVSISTAPGGAKIQSVTSGGPAASAGLQSGDLVTAVGRTKIASADELRAAINAKKPGDKIELKLTRNGSSKTLTVTLGQRPS